MPPRKEDVPEEVCEVLLGLHQRLRMSPGATSETRLAWYTEVKVQLSERGRQLAWAFVEGSVSATQITNYFVGENTVPQNNAPGSTSVTQTAGGNMTGVNATGDQKIRDINVYSQDLDQTGVSINAGVRTALVEARKSIEKSDIDPEMKPIIVENFDKLTEELKKGDKKNSSVTKMLWDMIYVAVQAVPAVVASLDKLKSLLGL